MKRSTRYNNVRAARREAHFTRNVQRMEFLPIYSDIYNGQGERVAARYAGHKPTLNRGVYHSRPEKFDNLMSNVVHLDLSRASEESQEAWAHA